MLLLIENIFKKWPANDGSSTMTIHRQLAQNINYRSWCPLFNTLCCHLCAEYVRVLCRQHSTTMYVNYKLANTENVK